MNSTIENHLTDYTYVVLSYTRYQSFLELKKENDRLRKKLEEHLKFKPIEAPTERASDHEAISTETKSGDGSSTNIDLIDSVVAKVLERLATSNKIGTGSDGLIENISDPLPPEESSPNLISNEELLDRKTSDVSRSDVTTSDNLNSMDEKLLSLVSPFRRPKATKLLNSLKHQSDIRFDSTGLIYLNEEQLDNANIYSLFPLLFKPAQYAKHPHLQDLVNEISTLGLGHLISRFYSAGLTPRGQNIIPERAEMHQEIKSHGRHWYKMSDD